MIAPYSQTARSTIWNHAERDRRRAEPPPHIPPRWYLREWLPWNKAHQDAFLKDSATWSLYWYIASYMNKYAIDQDELAEKDAQIDAQAKSLAQMAADNLALREQLAAVKTIPATPAESSDLQFWKGEAALFREQAGDLRDGHNRVRDACNAAGETEGPLDQRVANLAADRDMWKAAHDHISFSFREQSRKQPVTPDASVEVPRQRTTREASHDGETKESVQQG